MRKLYGILLFALFTINATQERPTFFSRTRQFTVRFKEKFLRKIKQQYRDKHKRRVWLSSGAVCLVSLLSWRLVAFQKMWKRKKEKAGTAEKKQLPEAVRDQSEDVQAARKALVKNGRASRAPHDASDIPDNREALVAAMEAAERLGNPPVEGTDDAPNLVRFDDPSSSTATHFENDGGTMVGKSAAEIAEKAKAPQVPVPTKEKLLARLGKLRAQRPIDYDTSSLSVAGPISDTCIIHGGTNPPEPHLAQKNKRKDKRIVVSPEGQNDPRGIQEFVQRNSVVSTLRDLKRKIFPPEEAAAALIEKLTSEGETEDRAAQIVGYAESIIARNRALDIAINESRWNDVITLLPSGDKASAQYTERAKRILNKISGSKTMHKNERDALAMILWQLFWQYDAEVNEQGRDAIQQRRHNDTDEILGMLPPPKSPPS